MFCGIDSIMWLIPTFSIYMENIRHNIVGPREHYYGSEYGFE